MLQNKNCIDSKRNDVNLSEKVCSLLASSTGICWASVVHIYGVFCAIQHVDTKSFPVGSSTVVYGQNTDGNSTVDALWHTNLIDQPTRRHTFYSPFDPMSRAIMDNITSATSYILTRSCKQLISISQSKTVATANACTGIEQVARSEQFGYAVNWVTRVNLVNTFLPSFYYHFFSLFPFSRCFDDQIKFYFLIFPRAPPFLHVLVITQRCCRNTWVFFYPLSDCCNKHFRQSVFNPALNVR